MRAPTDRLFRAVAAFVLVLPRKHARGSDEADAGAARLWSFLEDHGAIVFPLLAVGVVALVAWALRRGAQSTDAELQHRRAQKDAIIRLMRARLMLTPETTAAELQVDRFHAAALLDELQREGTLVQHHLEGGVATYRLKGL